MNLIFRTVLFIAVMLLVVIICNKFELQNLGTFFIILATPIIYAILTLIYPVSILKYLEISKDERTSEATILDVHGQLKGICEATIQFYDSENKLVQTDIQITYFNWGWSPYSAGDRVKIIYSKNTPKKAMYDGGLFFPSYLGGPIYGAIATAFFLYMIFNK